MPTATFSVLRPLYFDLFFKFGFDTGREVQVEVNFDQKSLVRSKVDESKNGQTDEYIRTNLAIEALNRNWKFKLEIETRNLNSN